MVEQQKTFSYNQFRSFKYQIYLFFNYFSHYHQCRQFTTCYALEDNSQPLLNSRTIKFILFIFHNMMLASGTEKKLVHIFKLFVEKAFLPQIRKFQGSVAEWSKFSSLLMADNLNYGDLQSFVDSLPSIPIIYIDKNQQFTRKNQSELSEPAAFNPSKTFGGERNKLTIFNIAEEKNDNSQTKRQPQRDDSLRQRVNQNNLAVFSNLQKLLKNLEENQQVINNLVKQQQNIPVKLARESPIQYSSPINPNINNYSYSSSYGYIPGPVQTSHYHQGGSQSQPHSHSQPHSQNHSGSIQTYSQTHIPNGNFVKGYF